MLLLSLLMLTPTVLANNTNLANQVEALWQVKNYQAAQALLADKVNKKSKDSQLLALWGETEAKLNNIDLAEEILKKAIQLDGSNADYQHWYATASCNKAASVSMFSALGYAKRCKKAYEAALALAPEHPRSYIALGSYLAQAPSIAGGDKKAALELVNQLKKIDELQGLLLELKMTDFKDEAMFEQFLADKEILTQRPEAYFYRGQQLSSSEDYSGAIGYFQLALQQAAVDDDAVTILAETRYQLARNAVLGQTAATEGIVVLTQYLTESTDAKRNEWAKYRLAQLHLLNDDKGSAQLIVDELLATTQDEKLKHALSDL
ncbi:hypothetical protein BI198_13000 [Rheinheimera salexigens]|uniref:Tetratricopeptide repeat protein n=2 Tax=Rheinheimera salexigens TaxID=1628148 RepID=A0A1E7QAP5_9GAMM|nr:hypothetical protein BI198_13000 [Rheinheimera salexigens]